ncbi:MAG: ATP-binding domain-containing protein, partial [Nocardioidaceae bacterium]
AVLGDLVERMPGERVAGARAGAGTSTDVSAGASGSAPLDLATLVPADVADLTEAERSAAETQAVVHLTTVHRYSAEIHELAEGIRAGSIEQVEAVLASGHPSLEFEDEDPGLSGVAPASLRTDVVAAGTALVTAARRGDAVAALGALEQHRVLCAHREGPYGVARWARQVQEWLVEEIDGYGTDGFWYVGRPLLVTSNDYQLRLFNGDTGVVVAGSEEDGSGVRAAFRRDGAVDLLSTSRLADVQTVHAMSVHRSQGSQFDRVTLVLPPVDSPLATRELVYTAVTRAKEHVRIVGTREALVRAIQRPIVRASGLRRVRAR